MTFNAAAFFDHCRATVMGPTLEQNEVDGANVILAAFAGQPRSWCAYALATAWHETAHTMLPISEYGGKAYCFRMYDIEGQRPKVARALGNTVPGDGWTYRGRGYVQLTGRANYAKAGSKLGIDLIGSPDRAMEHRVAADIMKLGMGAGWFTGRTLGNILPAGRNATDAEFRKARTIINAMDKAALIAGYAAQFQAALEKGGW